MKRLTICLAIAAATTATAQQTLTLEQCRQMALSNNIAIRNAERSVQQAKHQKSEALTSYFPSVSAMGGTAKLSEDLLGMFDGGTMATVTATQPLFAGGQIVNGNKLARVGYEASQIQREQEQDNVALTAEKYFWQVVTLEEKLITLDKISAMLNTLKGDVGASVNAGVALRNDLLQVELKLNDVESSRIKLRNGISLAKMALAQYAGIEGDYTLAGNISTDAMPPSPTTMRQNHDQALSATTEYRLLEKNVESAKLQRRIELGKRLPSVAVGVGYAYNHFMHTDYDFGLAFATVSIPISDWWGGSHAIKRKKIAETTAKEQLTDNGELLLIRMQKTWNDLDDAYKQLAIARKSMEQSEENLRLNNDYYAAGTTTMSDLLDAQQLYQQAHDAYTEAYAEYNTKAAEYRIATGQTLF